MILLKIIKTVQNIPNHTFSSIQTKISISLNGHMLCLHNDRFRRMSRKHIYWDLEDLAREVQLMKSSEKFWAGLTGMQKI